MYDAIWATSAAAYKDASMRIVLVTICSLIASLIIFWTVKFWGRSLQFVPYDHPIYSHYKANSQPILFVKPAASDLESAMLGSENLYLDVASTSDQKVVLPRKVWGPKEKAIRYRNYEDIKSDVFLLSEWKEKLADRKIIFNLIENAQAGHVIFFDEIKKMNWEKGENFIVTSPYEAMARALKEIAPAWLYGSTQPEILRLVAMKSMLLIEAVSFRADIIIHPLLIRNQPFYDEVLLKEIDRRHKKIIVGPVSSADLIVAQQLNPLGIIIAK